MKAGSKLRDIQISDEDYLILLQGHIAQLKERCLTIKKTYLKLIIYIAIFLLSYFGIKEGNTKRCGSLCSSFNWKHKNTFIWVPWHYRHMHYKTKVSCIFKIQILSFMTQTLFAHILGDCIYHSKYVQKG